jgi:hypothetical protein
VSWRFHSVVDFLFLTLGSALLSANLASLFLQTSHPIVLHCVLEQYTDHDRA